MNTPYQGQIDLDTLQADGVTKLGWMKDHDNQVSALRLTLLKDANGKVIL